MSVRPGFALTPVLPWPRFCPVFGFLRLSDPGFPWPRFFRQRGVRRAYDERTGFPAANCVRCRVRSGARWRARWTASSSGKTGTCRECWIPQGLNPVPVRFRRQKRCFTI